MLFSVSDMDKPEAVEVAKEFHEAGFRILATGRTCDVIQEAGIPVEKIKKLYQGRPNILDAIKNGDIQMVINTPIGKEGKHDDSYIRKAAIKARIPYMTTMAAAAASISGIRAVQRDGQIEAVSYTHLGRRQFAAF